MAYEENFSRDMDSGRAQPATEQKLEVSDYKNEEVSADSILGPVETLSMVKERATAFPSQTIADESQLVQTATLGK